MTILIESSRCAREDMTSARLWCPPWINVTQRMAPPACRRAD